MYLPTPLSEGQPLTADARAKSKVEENLFGNSQTLENSKTLKV
jgi:hypothetical protein